MRITQWGEYGVHFAVYLARAARGGVSLISAADLAVAQGIDLQYAQQILRRLRQGGIVESIRGPQGGYRLKRSAESITLLEILLATEGETFELVCDSKPLSRENCHSETSCGLRKIWSELRTHVDEFLKAYTLDKLAETPTGVRTFGHQSPVLIGSGKKLFSNGPASQVQASQVQASLCEQRMDLGPESPNEERS